MPKESQLFTRFIDPAVALAVITSVLYFWGYAYFAAYCEQLGASFAGFDVPLPHYFVVGWDKIFYIALALCLLLGYVEFILWLLSSIAKAILKLLFKKYPKFSENTLNATWLDDLPKGKLNRFGMLLAIAIGIAIWGAKDLVEKGEAAADKALASQQLVAVVDTNHEPIDGPYVYLGNFSGDLIVGEIVEGSNEPDIRIFKDGSYSSYILQQTSPKEEIAKSKGSLETSQINNQK